MNTTNTRNVKLVLSHGGKVERPSWKVGVKTSVTPLHNTVQTSQANMWIMEHFSVAAVKKRKEKRKTKITWWRWRCRLWEGWVSLHVYVGLCFDMIWFFKNCFAETFWLWWRINFFCSAFCLSSLLSAAFYFILSLSLWNFRFDYMKQNKSPPSIFTSGLFLFQSCLARSRTHSQGSLCLVREASKSIDRLLCTFNLCNIEIIKTEDNCVVYAPIWSRDDAEHGCFTALSDKTRQSGTTRDFMPKNPPGSTAGDTSVCQRGNLPSSDKIL